MRFVSVYVRARMWSDTVPNSEAVGWLLNTFKDFLRKTYEVDIRIFLTRFFVSQIYKHQGRFHLTKFLAGKSWNYQIEWIFSTGMKTKNLDSSYELFFLSRWIDGARSVTPQQWQVFESRISTGRNWKSKVPRGVVRLFRKPPLEWRVIFSLQPVEPVYLLNGKRPRSRAFYSGIWKKCTSLRGY